MQTKKPTLKEKLGELFYVVTHPNAKPEDVLAKQQQAPVKSGATQSTPRNVNLQPVPQRMVAVEDEDDEDDDVETINFENEMKKRGIKTSTRGDKVWNVVADIFVIACGFVFWMMLGVGDALLFSGFQNIQSNPWYVGLMWVGAPFIEGLIILLIVRSAFVWRSGKNHHPRAVAMMIAGGLMSIFSLSAQWVFLVYEASKTEYDAMTLIAVKMHVPVPILLVLFVRALIPTIGTFLLVFLLPDKKLDVPAAIADRKQKQRLLMELEEAEQEMELRDIIHRSNVADMQGYIDFKRSGQEYYVQQMRDQKFVVQHVESPQLDAPKQNKPVPGQFREYEVAQRLPQKQEQRMLPEDRTPKQQQPAPQRQYQLDPVKLRAVVQFLQLEPHCSNADIADMLAGLTNSKSIDIGEAKYYRAQAGKVSEKRATPQPVKPEIHMQQPPVVKTPVRSLHRAQIEKADTTVMGHKEEDDDPFFPFLT